MDPGSENPSRTEEQEVSRVKLGKAFPRSVMSLISLLLRGQNKASVVGVWGKDEKDKSGGRLCRAL